MYQVLPDKQQAYEEYVANNSDFYGSGVVQYAKRWAELMEAQMEQGALIEHIADPTSQTADVDGITGFMYGCAVSELSSFWVHGDRLRRWHNLTTQIRDEGERANKSGGVLNPAIVNM